MFGSLGVFSSLELFEFLEVFKFFSSSDVAQNVSPMLGPHRSLHGEVLGLGSRVAARDRIFRGFCRMRKNAKEGTI